MRRRRRWIAAGVGVALALTGAAPILWWPWVNEVETGASAAYPALEPRRYEAPPAAVRGAVTSAIRAMPRWRIAESDEKGPLRATHRTDGFGFVDDVTVWIEPIEGDRTRVRVRSASRIGQIDFGQNARNIRSLFRALDKRLRNAGGAGG